MDTITSWVADGAQWILGRVIGFISHTASPSLNAAWFVERFHFMIGLGALVLVPMLILAAIRAVMTQDASQLVRSFFVYLPLAVLGTFAALFFVRAMLSITDAMSASVSQNVAGDTSQIFHSVGKTLTNSIGAVSPGAPSFAIFFGALLLILGSFFVWLELLVRSAAVTVSVFFLPLILAGLVWPATAHWTRRLIEILVALILSKFVVVAVISLATAAMSDPGGGGFGTVMGASALMLMAGFSPFALLRLIPALEGATVDHLQGLSRRPFAMARPDSSVHHAVSQMRCKTGTSQSQELKLAGSASGSGATTAAGAAVATGVAAAKAAKKTGERAGASLDKQLRPNSSDKRPDERPATGKSTAGGSTGLGATPPRKRQGPKKG